MYIRGSLKRLVPLIVWITVIFGLSSIPQLSGEYPDWPFPVDKAAHFVEYLVLAMLFHRGVWHGTVTRRLLRGIVVLVICLLVAVLDELYQSFVPGRQSSGFDVLADFFGIVVGTSAATFRESWNTGKDRGAHEIQSSEGNE